MISAEWRRAPCTNTPASVSGGFPTATLAISVAVSIASHGRPFIPAPPTAIASPQLLQNANVWRVTVTQSKVPIERRHPWARPLRPFDEHDGALARHVLKPDIPGLVGQLEAIAIDVIDGSGPSVVVMHQRIGGARRQRRGPQATANRLHQGRLARPQLAREPGHGRGRQVAAQRFTEPVEVVRAEAHAAPHLPGP